MPPVAPQQHATSSDSLREHVQRVTYQVAIWKRAHVTKPDVPNPSRGHGWILKDNVLEPMWTSGNILPQQMVDIVDTYEDEECRNADSDMERDEFEFVEYESRYYVNLCDENKCVHGNTCFFFSVDL